MGFYEPTPGYTNAYHVDSSENEYFGKAPKGAKTSSPQWTISKMEYTGENWIIKYPNGDDSPKYIWDNVESYTYNILGTV